MLFADALTLDAPRRTQDGYMAVRAKAARTGVYDYLASEPSIADALPEGHSFKPTDVVKVLRDENTVFDPAAVRSFIGKPITDDHPHEAVTSDNWREHARGVVMGAKWEEGGYLAFDLMLTDADAIAKVEAGKRELSNGYSAALEFGDFTAPDGTKCHARQTSIIGNHVAIVDRGRAGSTCRITDAATCESLPSNLFDHLKTEKPVKTMLIDGLTVDVSNADTAEATIKTLVAARDAATAKVTGLETQVATLTTDKATLEAEKVTLTQQLADAASPAKLRDAAKAYAAVVEKAKALGVAVTDAMGQTDIVKAVVDAKIDASLREGWTDAQYAASFASLTKDVKPEQGTAPSISGSPVNLGDAATQADTAWAKANDDLNAWRAA